MTPCPYWCDCGPCSLLRAEAEIALLREWLVRVAGRLVLASEVLTKAAERKERRGK